jgi:hypothetical protein
MHILKLVFALFFLSIFVISSACSSGQTTTSSTQEYSQYQLEYRIAQNYPDLFWCDPDYYPISREGQEQANALEQFSSIKANGSEFAAILEHLALPNKSDFSDQEKLLIYKEHKLLSYGISITPAGGLYNFVVRTGENEGKRLEGTVTSTGQIKVLKEETSFNTCPICLTAETLISTPTGQIPVQQLKTGIPVWTINERGELTALPILKTSSTAVPSEFEIVRITLADGRTLAASPGHPSADLIPLAAYHEGDVLDGSIIVSLENESYNGGFTYDLLPDGPTGFYLANGIILKSTLVR